MQVYVLSQIIAIMISLTASFKTKICNLKSTKRTFITQFLSSNNKGITDNRRRTALNMSSSSVHSPKVLVPIANGSEEIETTTIINTLVRGGVTVVVASVETTLMVTCSRGVKIVADYFIPDCVQTPWDMIVCPGGMPGAEHLRDSKYLQMILKHQNSQGKYVAAICASPAVVLASLGLLLDKRATGYPAPQFITALSSTTLGPSLYSTEKVVVDENIITSQGPATSIEFSLKLLEILMGIEVANKVAKQMLAT